MFTRLTSDTQLEPGDYRLELSVPSWALTYVDEHPGFSEEVATFVANLSGAAVVITAVKSGYRVDRPSRECLVILFTVPEGVITPIQAGIPVGRVIAWIARILFFGFAVVGIYAVTPEPIKDGLPDVGDVGEWLQGAAVKTGALVVGGVALWFWMTT